MNRLLAALLALALAGQADARALIVRSSATGTGATGIDVQAEAVLSTLNTLGASYHVRNICDFPEGSTEAMRRGAVYPNGIGVGDSLTYGLVIILGDARTDHQWTVASTSAQAGTGGYATLRNGNANAFLNMRPGMALTGTPITASAIVVGVDSLYQRMTVKGTVAYSASFTLTWRVPMHPDSLTLTAMYPRVPILRFGQFMGSTSAFGTSASAPKCSTGVVQTATYTTHQDSTRSVYDVGNHYRSWKARQWYAASSTRDTRGWRAILGSSVTRAGDGTDLTNYDFVSSSYASAAFSANPDTVVVWAVMNWGADGTPIGGDAAPNIYAILSYVNGSANIDPGTLLTALAFADSVSGGALFSDSEKLPRKMGFHIDDGWKRGDSKYNVSGAYGGIGVDDTTAFKASIDSLASLAIPFVVGVELDSLESVLLSAGVTGDGDLYDKVWWARAPMAHYTPHCHAGLVSGTNRTQNNEIVAGEGMKFLRPLDIWGLSRTRYAFGSTDSALAGLGTDYWNDVADSAATYWLNKRAFAMCDSTFGKSKVDRLVMPPGDDWTNFQVKHTRKRQHGLGVDSIMAAAVASGATGIRMNAGINVFGNDDSTTTNNYGWWTTGRTMKVGAEAGAAGSPSWFTASMYGRPCHMVPTDGYPANSSYDSWSVGRTSYGGEKFLNGLLLEHVNVSADPTTAGRGVFILASHASDFGSSGDSGYQTRPMFYTFKYVANAIRTANDHALRDLVQMVYPDQVRP